jgi:Ion channel
VKATLFGVAVLLLTAAIHVAITIGLIDMVRTLASRFRRRPVFSAAFGLMSLVVLGLMISHVLHVALWAAVFYYPGPIPDLETAFYHSFVNYTTLGYGDIVMPAPWRLLGAIEAADGYLMFGLSTAVMFEVLTFLYKARVDAVGAAPGTRAGTGGGSS